MSSHIIARADALMQRRRHGGIDVDDVPVLTDAVDADEDVPILVDAEPQAPLEASPPPGEAGQESASGPALDDTLLDIIAHELARRISERIAAEMPAIIEATVRDFLAEPETLARFRPRD